MGGAKKRSLSKIEKQQYLRSQKQQQQRRKSSRAKTSNEKASGFDLPNLRGKDLTSELTKMKAITPYTIASRYEIGIGMAKNILKNLEKRGVISLVASNSNLKIYSSKNQ